MEFEQNHHVALVFHKALGLLDHHLGDLHVARWRLVEGRGNDLALHRALHVGDFLGPLVDQQHDQIALGMIGRDRVGDVLQQHGLAGARRRHDEGALALAHRRHDIDDARREVLERRVFDLELQPLGRIERREVVEVDLVFRRFGLFEVDLAHLQKGEVALAFLGRADLAFDRIARAQRKAPDLRGRHVDVVGSGQVVGVGRAQEAEAVQQHFHDAGAGDFYFFGGELFQRREHQLLLAHGAGVFDAVLLREAQELRGRLELQVFKLHFGHGTLRWRRRWGGNLCRARWWWEKEGRYVAVRHGAVCLALRSLK